MRMAVPDIVRRLPLADPELAIQQFAAIIAELRDAPDGAAADLEAIATEAVETALSEGAFLLAVVTPPGAAPALLTGVVLEVPPSWDPDTAEALRDAVENVGGPDVRETIALDTGLGPAVIAQRVPGPEQARGGRPLTLQLQAFLAEPGTGRMTLLTLACPALHGWVEHQSLFVELVASAAPADRPASTANAATAEDESFEHHTYRLP